MANSMSLALFFTLVCSSMIVRADEPRLGPLTHAGNGCPSSSASVELNSKAKTFSIRFDSFHVQLGNQSGGALARKTCNLAIPVHVPPGQKVSISALDFQGTLALSEGVKAQVSVSPFFAGQAGQIVQKTFQGNENKKFVLTAPDPKEGLIWSSCGGDTILRLNLSLVLNASTLEQNSKPAQVILGTAVPHAGATSLIQSKPCNE